MIEADLRRLLRDDQRTAFADRRDARGVYLAWPAPPTPVVPDRMLTRSTGPNVAGPAR